MNPLLKKILIIAGIVLIVGALVFVLFFSKGTLDISLNPNTARIDIDGVSKIGSSKIKLKPGKYILKISSPGYVSYEKNIELKTAKTEKITVELKTLPKVSALTDTGAQYVIPGKDGNSLFYLGNTGKTMYRMSNADSTSRSIAPITPDVFASISNVLFSPDQSLAIYKKNGETYLYDFMRYDLLHQEIINLGKNIGDIVWSPDGEKIAYYYQTPEGERTLIRASKDNKTVERIYNLKDTDITNPTLDWSKDGKYILVLKNDLFVFDIYTKNLVKITENKKITEAKFIPDSSGIIFNELDGNENIKLSLIDLNGNNVRELSFKTTLDKVTWLDEKNIIAALPNLTDSGSSDKLIKLNIDSFNEAEFQFDSTSGKTVIANPIIIDAKNNLYFIFNNNLNALELVSNIY